MLGKYSTKVVLPKSKSDLARAINSLGPVDIKVWEPVDKSNISLIKSQLERVVGSNKTKLSIVTIAETQV